MTINKISKLKHALYVIALAVFMLANTETIKAAGTQESIYSDLPVFQGNALELWEKTVSIAEANNNWLAEFTYITMEAFFGNEKVKESKRTIHTSIDNDGNIINETIEDTRQESGEDNPHKSSEDMEKMKEILDRMNDNGGLIFLNSRKSYLQHQMVTTVCPLEWRPIDGQKGIAIPVCCSNRYPVGGNRAESSNGRIISLVLGIRRT